MKYNFFIGKIKVLKLIFTNYLGLKNKVKDWSKVFSKNNFRKLINDSFDGYKLLHINNNKALYVPVVRNPLFS